MGRPSPGDSWYTARNLELARADLRSRFPVEINAMPIWLSYPLVTLLVSVPFYLYIYRRGGVEAERFPARMRRMLWVPALVAFGFRFTTGEGFVDLGYTAGEWPLLLVAALLPVAVDGLLVAVSVSLGWASIPPQVARLVAGKVEVGERLGLLLDEPRQPVGRFVLNLLASLLVGTVFGALFAFGAEFGWRGYLLPRAIQALGLAGGLLVTGLAWGYWHLPLVLMGYRFPRHRRLGAALLMPLTAIALGTVAGWFYFRAGTLWAPTLFHAGFLITTELSRRGLGTEGDDLRVQVLGLGLWTLIAALAFLLWPG